MTLAMLGENQHGTSVSKVMFTMAVLVKDALDHPAHSVAGGFPMLLCRLPDQVSYICPGLATPRMLWQDWKHCGFRCLVPCLRMSIQE